MMATRHDRARLHWHYIVYVMELRAQRPVRAWDYLVRSLLVREHERWLAFVEELTGNAYLPDRSLASQPLLQPDLD